LLTCDIAWREIPFAKKFLIRIIAGFTRQKDDIYSKTVSIKIQGFSKEWKINPFFLFFYDPLSSWMSLACIFFTNTERMY